MPNGAPDGANETRGHQKSGKASFGEIYDLEDPREYFRVLGELDYAIPEHGRRVFGDLVERLGERGETSPVRVVDVCCSYGINAALMKHDLALDDLYERYASPEVSDLSSGELAVSDAAFYARKKREGAPEVVGLDISDEAVSYGIDAGLLDAGFTDDLEDREPGEGLRGAVAGADLLTVTGGVGYISERTFDRLLGCVEGETPWVAAFALRWVSYEEISSALATHGLVTEKLEGRTFEQRRFASEAERAYTVEELSKAGLETAGLEDEGSYHAEFYLSRPREVVEEEPLRELLEGPFEG